MWPGNTSYHWLPVQPLEHLFVSVDLHSLTVRTTTDSVETMVTEMVTEMLMVMKMSLVIVIPPQLQDFVRLPHVSFAH